VRDAFSIWLNEHGELGAKLAELSRPHQPPLSDCYAVLGVTTANSNDEIKRAYRKLMKENHPDKLIAKGLPQEMIKIATEKTQHIQTAYERVRKERGIK
jgi:DnaJ like chaperone protein